MLCPLTFYNAYKHKKEVKQLNLNELITKMTAGEVAGWGLLALALLLSLVQISPLKLNPWDRIFGWIGKKANGKIQGQLDALSAQVREMWINKHRQTLLIFARECRAGIDHSPDEWVNALNVADEGISFHVTTLPAFW